MVGVGLTPSSVKVSDTYSFHGKVLEPKDIRQLAKIVHTEYTTECSDLDQKRKEENERAKAEKRYTDSGRIMVPKIEFSLSTESGKTFEAIGMEVFEDEYLEDKRIVSVSISYHSYESGKSIDIRIGHEVRESSLHNRVNVSGYDENWVNGVIRRVENTIGDSRNQYTLLTRHWYIVPLLISLAIAWLAASITIAILNVSSGSSDASSFDLAYLFFLYSLMIGWVTFLVVPDRIRKLFPAVELATGPDYARSEETRRRKISYWLSGIILPTLIGIAITLVAG